VHFKITFQSLTKILFAKYFPKNASFQLTYKLLRLCLLSRFLFSSEGTSKGGRRQAVWLWLSLWDLLVLSAKDGRVEGEWMPVAGTGFVKAVLEDLQWPNIQIALSK
jgi:hypothetical protein